MEYKWEDIYSQFEKIRVKKHISILKNTRVNNVIVPFINEKYIDIYDFVPTTLYSKNKKQILSNVTRIKKYLIANPNTVRFIETLTNVRYKGMVSAAICMYASIYDFEYRDIYCDFSLSNLKKEIKRFLRSVDVELSFNSKYPIFEEYILSNDMLNSISSITFSKFLELSILNLDFITRNYKIVHYITTGSVET